MGRLFARWPLAVSFLLIMVSAIWDDAGQLVRWEASLGLFVASSSICFAGADRRLRTLPRFLQLLALGLAFGSARAFLFGLLGLWGRVLAAGLVGATFLAVASLVSGLARGSSGRGAG